MKVSSQKFQPKSNAYYDKQYQSSQYQMTEVNNKRNPQGPNRNARQPYNEGLSNEGYQQSTRTRDAYAGDHNNAQYGGHQK